MIFVWLVLRSRRNPYRRWDYESFHPQPYQSSVVLYLLATLRAHCLRFKKKSMTRSVRWRNLRIQNFTLKLHTFYGPPLSPPAGAHHSRPTPWSMHNFRLTGPELLSQISQEHWKRVKIALYSYQSKLNYHIQVTTIIRLFMVGPF